MMTELMSTVRGVYGGLDRSHHSEMAFRIGPDGLTGRHDYDVDVWADSPAAHSLLDHIDVDGLKCPARRKVYVRKTDGILAARIQQIWATFSNLVLE